MGPRLSDLGPYLGLFRPYLGWLLAGLGLSVLTLSGSLGLLSLSGGFLTATGLAGLVPETALLFNVVVPSGGIRLFALVRTASRWSERVINHEATFRLLGQLRVRLYDRLSRLSPRQLGLWHGGEVLNRLTKDVDLLDNLFIRLLVPIGAATMVLGSVVTLAWVFSPVLAGPVGTLALVGLVVLPLGLYLSGRHLAPRLVDAQGRVRRALLDLVDGLEEWAFHLPAWKVQRDRVLTEDRLRMDDHDRLHRRGAGARAGLTLLIGMAVWSTLGLVATGAAGRSLDGPWFVALTLLVLGLGEALIGLPQAWLDLPGTANAARRLSALADQVPHPGYSADPAAVPAHRDLSLEAVGFGYDPQIPILTEVSLSLPSGTHASLVGPSGGGKTTLVRLLTRLEDPTQGRLMLGGLDLRSWPEDAFRTAVAATTQDPWAFTATVAENLRIADPSAADDELWRVLDLVGLGAQVRRWPEGLRTWIEEGGQSLSGGQRRRLAIARVLLRRAAVTILDEPTEGLESSAAATLVTQVRQELAGRTLLWVTHRAEGLDSFGEVWTVTGGRVLRG